VGTGDNQQDNDGELNLRWRLWNWKVRWFRQSPTPVCEYFLPHCLEGPCFSL